MPLAEVEGAVIEELERVRRDGVTGAELARARNQMRARLVFDQDSVTNIAHQLGYFETIADAGLYARIVAALSTTTSEQVAAAADRWMRDVNRTVGWFEPAEPAEAFQPAGAATDRAAARACARRGAGLR